VSGASGYLGSRIADRLEADGWYVTRLVRTPDPADSSQRLFDLRAERDPVIDTSDVLIHAAYDFSLHRRADIWRVNVDGTRRLLHWARAAGIRRIIVLSTMSAYEGTRQLYGTAKLDIERETAAVGGTAVRPGLVYGRDAGGMFGALRKAVHLPFVPLVAPTARQFPVHEEDLLNAIAVMAAAPELPAGPIGIAQRTPVPFREIMTAIATNEGMRVRFVPFPWRVLYAALRAAELVGFSSGFRADSLLGLVRPAPDVPNPDALDRLGIRIRPFAPEALG